MDKELIKQYLENLAQEYPDTCTISIHIEGEEDYTEVEWNKEATFNFGEDAILLKSSWKDSDSNRKLDQFLIRLSKVVSISIA